MKHYRTGLNISPNPPQLRFEDFFNAAVLPAIPDAFGQNRFNLVPAQGWGMLDNDVLGDCTIAGAMHCAMLWNKVAGRTVNFTNLDAIDDFTALTGGNLADGADISTLCDYWRKTGVRDNTAARHQIAAYLSVDPTNLAHIDAACYLFYAVGIGITLPDDADEQFLEGSPWTGSDAGTANYHFVPIIGKDPVYRQVITWGAVQDVDQDWLVANIKEAVAVISQEDMTNGKTVEGFDMTSLQNYLEQLG